MPDVKIKGYSAEFTYKDVPMLWLADPSQEIGELEEGETPNLVPFTYGQAVPKTVAPDFSGGDMAVEIPEGELVNQLTITKPADLIPENIPEGMYIAGVGPGTFAGGSGDDGSAELLEYENKYIEEIAPHTYQGMTNLKSVAFSGVLTIGSNGFMGCTNLDKADFHVLSSIYGGGNFNKCIKLEALIIRTSTMCSIADDNTINTLFGTKIGSLDYRTPIKKGTGYIYVPSALVEMYKADTKWSKFTTQFRAIEDYPDICG